jgi:hypothetical protein
MPSKETCKNFPAMDKKREEKQEYKTFYLSNINALPKQDLIASLDRRVAWESHPLIFQDRI